MTYTKYITNEKSDSDRHKEKHDIIAKRCEYLSSISPEAREVYEEGFKKWIDISNERVGWRIISFLSFVFSIITTTLGYIIFSSSIYLESKPLVPISLLFFTNVVVLFLTLSSITTWIRYHVFTIH